MKISEMKVGQNILSRMVLADATLRKTKGNPPKDFLAVTFADGVDSLTGNIWNYRLEGDIPCTGKVYNVTGTIGEFAGKKQITVGKMVLDADQDMTDFMCTYDPDLTGLWARIEYCIADIKHTELRNVTEYIYNKYKDEILMSSSAKAVHHVGIGGNVAHTLEVYDYANSIVDTLEAEGKTISRSLVMAGALLHDIGKPFTYTINGPVVDVTQDGQMLDHIVLGLRILDETLANLGPDYGPAISLLSHVVASHHGQLEYGSPVTPRFAEAYIVNMADGISASLDTLYAANDKAVKEGKELTDKLFTLGNREHILQQTVNDMISIRHNV